MSANKRRTTTRASTEGSRTKAAGPQYRKLALRRILVPLDFSGKSRQALDFAVPLAQQYGGKIILVHVVELMPSYPPYPAEMMIAAPTPRPDTKASREALSNFARELVPRELLARAIVRTGRAYREILDVAIEEDVDLIVIATHGYTGLKHVLLGSTTEHVVRYAHCPVLTVRRD